MILVLLPLVISPHCSYTYVQYSVSKNVLTATVSGTVSETSLILYNLCIFM